MTNWNRIRQTLNAAGAFGGQPAIGSARQVVLKTIDRAVLPVRTELRFQDGTGLELFVRNRRLHAVAGAALGDANGLECAPEQAQIVADALMAACANRTLEAVNAMAFDAEDATRSLGLSVDTLEACFPVSGDTALPPDLQDRMDRFSNHPEAEVQASFLLEGEDLIPLTGEPPLRDDLLDPIINVLGRMTAESFVLAGSLETDGVLALPHPLVDGGSLMIVGHMGLLGVLVMDSVDPAEAQRLWAEAG